MQFGRFFYRPSKYDKERHPVEVLIHNGELLDFYSIFPRQEHFEPFDRLMSKLRYTEWEKQMKRSEGRNFADVFTRWLDDKGPLHYPDICAVVLRAQSCGVSFDTAMQMFKARYAGKSNWETNFEKFWYNHT